MLKIGKGLKKKKKSKKHKKEEELFKPEELEQYRREHQSRANESDCGTDEHVDSDDTSAVSKKQVDNDEWKKFNALTAGVDSILKKTQGDLDRIKSTSFFKKAPPPKPAPPKVESKPVEVEENDQKFSKSEESHAVTTNFIPQFVEEESESEYEEEEDIFDTSYVDVVASGEIKLAYVPDSPTDENTQDDFDPFDTSAAEKIIRGPEVSKKGKKIVSIGSAVEVLTGRIESVSSCAIGKKSTRRIQGNTDLLLDATEVDSNGNPTTTTEENVREHVEKSLLDDDEFIPIKESVDLSILPPVQKKVEVTETDLKENEKNQDKSTALDLKEFDILASKDEDDLDNLDDEFASLASESLKSVKPQLNPEQIKNQVLPLEETNWDAFGNETNVQSAEHSETEYFTERKLSSVSIHVTDPTGQSETVVDNSEVTETLLLKPIERDLLGESTTDLSKLANQPIEPIEIKSEEELSYSDPFDTSVIDQINIPGKAELKFIEAELLGDNQSELKRSLSDLDFDPRKDEFVQSTEVDNNLESVTNNIENNLEFEEDDKDPFDTSFIATVVPGKAELKLIENELAELEVVTTTNNKLDEILNNSVKLSQKVTPPNNLPLAETKEATDLLFVDEEVNIKALTPAVEKPIAQEFDLSYTDPFDTSVACNILPGKAELKLLENELLTIQSPITIKPAKETIASVLPTAFAPVEEKKTSKPVEIDDLLADITEDNFEIKALTPKKSLSPTELDDFDPFDTSITTNLVPGKIELKLLESELIQ